MELSKELLLKVKGGTGGTDSPELPPREAKVAEQKKVELSSTDTIAPVEPLKP